MIRSQPGFKPKIPPQLCHHVLNFDILITTLQKLVYGCDTPNPKLRWMRGLSQLNISASDIL